MSRIERRNSGPGRPDYFVRRTRRRPWLETFDGDVIPAFDGPEACFEVEKLPRKPLRFLRQVERPSDL